MAQQRLIPPHDSPGSYAPEQQPIWRIWPWINRHPRSILIALIALSLTIACYQSATKLFWCDELITLAIARQGSFAGIWRALAAGADPNPPLSHWLVLESTRAFGDGELAVRLPAVLCTAIAIVSLWTILRRWVCPGYAAAGVLTFMATRGFDYAYNARSYAPLMGFSMASLALWLASTERTGWARFAALAGMATALALGLSSNYYGALAFLPIALGEAVRAAKGFPDCASNPLPAEGSSLVAGRVQPGVWVAMVFAALPLLAFLPLIRRDIAEFAPHAWNRTHAGMIVESYLNLVEAVFWPVFGLALYATWKRWRQSTHRVMSGPLWSGRSAVQPHEAAALGVLILYPTLGYLVAAGGADIIGARCVVPVCCGFGIAAGLLGRRIFGKSPRAGAMFLSTALLWVVARESACAIILVKQRTAFLALRDYVALQPLDRTIVVSDSLFVLPLAHYSTDGVRARILFPIDFDAIHVHEPDDSIEQNLWAGRNGIFPITIVAYDRSLFAGRELTLIARPDGWLAHRLISDCFHLSQPDHNPAWQHVGGVFTSLDHDETRLQLIMDN